MKGGQRKEVFVPKSTLKIERENAWALIKGFQENNKTYYTSIFTALKFATALKSGFNKESCCIPKVLSYRNSEEPNYPAQLERFPSKAIDYSRSYINT